MLQSQPFRGRKGLYKPGTSVWTALLLVGWMSRWAPFNSNRLTPQTKSRVLSFNSCKFPCKLARRIWCFMKVVRIDWHVIRYASSISMIMRHILMCFLSVTWLASGNWTNWSNWNDCTRTCGSGIQFRKRVCIHPKGELFCLGEKVQSRLCNSRHCPGNLFLSSNHWPKYSYATAELVRVNSQDSRQISLFEG